MRQARITKPSRTAHTRRHDGDAPARLDPRDPDIVRVKESRRTRRDDRWNVTRTSHMA